MASDKEGKDLAPGDDPRMSDYGIRAAAAINRLVPGPHRDKAVARLLKVSVRMAKYLRAGQHWTTDRLSQASAAIVGFDEALSTPNLHHSLDEIEREINEIRDNLSGGDRE